MGNDGETRRQPGRRRERTQPAADSRETEDGPVAVPPPAGVSNDEQVPVWTAHANAPLDFTAQPQPGSRVKDHFLGLQNSPERGVDSVGPDPKIQNVLQVFAKDTELPRDAKSKDSSRNL